MKRLLSAFALLAATSASAVEDEIPTIEEIIIEAPFDVRLELPQQSAVAEMIARIRLRTEEERLADLAKIDRNPVTRLLDLTRYSPIPLGASEDRIDTFFFSNALRLDLNPRNDDPLALGR